MAERDPRIVGITPAMREGSGLVEFSKRFPERYFDVAIAEQHAVTFAAGLAAEGLKPVVAIYSTFLQRAYDQLIHDVALQNLPVVFAVDRAGLVGSDGATHQGSYDLSFLRCIPNMVIMAPADENECRQMLYTATTLNGPAVVRYPRGSGPGVPLAAGDDGAADRQGAAAARGQAAGSRCWCSARCSRRRSRSPSVWTPRWSTCASSSRSMRTWCVTLAARHRAFVTIEENAILGGAGSAVGELLAAEGAADCRCCSIGIPDRFIEHGSRESCLAAAGLDAAGPQPPASSAGGRCRRQERLRSAGGA